MYGCLTQGILFNINDLLADSLDAFKMLALGIWPLGLVSSFNGISTLFRLFNAKAMLLEH